jgi:hypothetical protein
MITFFISPPSVEGKIKFGGFNTWKKRKLHVLPYRVIK